MIPHGHAVFTTICRSNQYLNAQPGSGSSLVEIYWCGIHNAIDVKNAKKICGLQFPILFVGWDAECSSFNTRGRLTGMFVLSIPWWASAAAAMYIHTCTDSSGEGKYRKTACCEASKVYLSSTNPAWISNSIICNFKYPFNNSNDCTTRS